MAQQQKKLSIVAKPTIITTTSLNKKISSNETTHLNKLVNNAIKTKNLPAQQSLQTTTTVLVKKLLTPTIKCVSEEHKPSNNLWRNNNNKLQTFKANWWHSKSIGFNQTIPQLKSQSSSLDSQHSQQQQFSTPLTIGTPARFLKKQQEYNLKNNKSLDERSNNNSKQLLLQPAKTTYHQKSSSQLFFNNKMRTRSHSTNPPQCSFLSYASTAQYSNLNILLFQQHLNS